MDKPVACHSCGKIVQLCLCQYEKRLTETDNYDIINLETIS